LRELLGMPTCAPEDRPPRRRAVRNAVLGGKDPNQLTQEELQELIATLAQLQEHPGVE
jgi:hypothetical protein